MNSSSLSIGVIGAGAWGTALATVAARRGHSVLLWSRVPATAARLNSERFHPRLPRMPLLSSIAATPVVQDLAACELLIIATPAQAMRVTLALCSGVLNRSLPVVIASKGIEIATGNFMTEILQQASPKAEPYILSGPGFAADVLNNKPTAVTLAGPTIDGASDLAACLSLPTFRIYSSVDLIGVQVGGAMKNVLAIACGISEGKQMGDSARAALTTRGFSEMLRFGRALGADPVTLTGLSGLGDLILTCSSLQSRNFSFGVALGRSGADLMPAGDTTIEGIPTTKAVMALATERAIDLPVCAAVNAILQQRLTIDEAVGQLLARPLRAESL
jgi:glycerol-3-phosphate dehydrogenase (NAD(P)+)